MIHIVKPNLKRHIIIVIFIIITCLFILQITHAATVQLTKIKATDAQAIVNWSIGPTQVILTKNVYNFSSDDHCGLTKDAFEMLTVKNGRFVLAEDILSP